MASLCSIEWRSRAWLLSKIPFLIGKCAHLVVSAQISLQAKHLTQVCEGEKQSQLLSTTSSLWFWRRISLVVHFRDKFLPFLCCGTSCFKNDFSLQCQKRTCLIFQQIFRSSATALLVKLVYFHGYVDLSLSQHVLRFSVLLQGPQKYLRWTPLPL